MNNDHCYYGKKASEYDAFGLVTPHHDAFQECIASVLKSGLDAIERPRILEIGCGTGLTTLRVRSAIPEAEIFAVDRDPSMLDVARCRVQGARIHYISEDAVTYLSKLEEHSFDAVYSAYCIHNLQPYDRMRLFGGIRHVLKNRGVFVNGDKIAQNDIVQHWQDLRTAIDSFQGLRGTEFSHLEGMWIQHYLEDEMIRLTETEQDMLLRWATYRPGTWHMRWGIDAVVSGTR